MSTVSVRDRAKGRAGAITIVLSIVGYAAVGGAFLVPEFQALFRPLPLGLTVDLLTHAIAAVNTVTVVTLSLGWYWIRNDEVKKHAAAMSTSFALILLFLGMYLPKVANGTKYFVLDSTYAWVPLWEWVETAYLIMLVIHILLSIISVPVVLYALVLGLTHTEHELRTETPHRRVGRIAAGAWILSLVLGVVTYLLLNHLYDSRPAAAEAAEAAAVLLPLVPGL